MKRTSGMSVKENTQTQVNKNSYSRADEDEDEDHSGYMQDHPVTCDLYLDKFDEEEEDSGIKSGEHGPL